MSANIRSMFYTGDKPWHELGKEVQNHLTSAEAIVAAGLDYTVEKKPLFLETSQLVKGHYATVRTDTNEYLGVVGNKYTVLQNKHAFSFFDGVVGLKEAMYETAGALGRGEKVWLLAKLPGQIRTKGDDITDKYLLLYNSHDGSGSVQIMFTPIRVVCQNTLNVAVGSASNRVSLRHTRNIGSKVEAVQEQLGIVNQRFSIFEEASRKLATVDLTKNAFKDYVRNSGLVPKIKDEKDESTRAKNILQDVTVLFENGKGASLPGARGTAWGAFNAISEYVDHYRGGKDREKRASSLLFGSGALIKQSAWNKALELVR